MQPNDHPPEKREKALSNPQVVTAIVTGVVTVMVAIVGIVPQIMNSNSAVPLSTPTVAPTVIVITSTPVPSPTPLLPTEAPPTEAPTALPPTTAAPAEPSPSPLPILPTTAAPTDQPATVVPPPTETPLQLTPNLVPSQTPVSALPTVETQPTTQPPASPPNARLLFDGVSLTLINQSGGTLSLVGVTFSSAVGIWEARVWGARVHDRLPAGQCLRLREAAVGQRTPPAECVNRIFGLIEGGGTAMFWRGVDSFNVQRNGEVIATCPTANGVCEVYIPQG